jgi:hypothetical protein
VPMLIAAMRRWLPILPGNWWQSAAPRVKTGGTSGQVMNDQIGPKIINLGVAKLSNSPAITYVLRLELNDFESKFDSLRLVQRFPG